MLQAIRDTKVNMTIWPAICESTAGETAVTELMESSDIDSNTDAYTTQLTAVQDALKTYGTDNIEGVSPDHIQRWCLLGLSRADHCRERVHSEHGRIFDLGGILSSGIRDYDQGDGSEIHAEGIEFKQDFTGRNE